MQKKYKEYKEDLESLLKNTWEGGFNTYVGFESALKVIIDLYSI